MFIVLADSIIIHRPSPWQSLFPPQTRAGRISVFGQPKARGNWQRNGRKTTGWSACVCSGGRLPGPASLPAVAEEGLGGGGRRCWASRGLAWGCAVLGRSRNKPESQTAPASNLPVGQTTGLPVMATSGRPVGARSAPEPSGRRPAPRLPSGRRADPL